MSLIEKQLADLLSTQPKKRPPRAGGEDAKPGQGVNPSVASLMALMTGTGGASSAKPKPADQPAPPPTMPPTDEPQAGKEVVENAPELPAAPILTQEAQPAPAMQSPEPPAMQPPPAPPAMQPPPAPPAMQPPPMLAEIQSPPPVPEPAPQKKERPDIQIALQSTVTGAVSPFAKAPLPFIKGLPGAPSVESPVAFAPAEAPAAPQKPIRKPDLGEKPKNLAGTVTATTSPFAKAPLPFSKATAGRAAPQPAEAPPPPPANLDATAIGSISPFASALPFDAGAPSRLEESAPSPPVVRMAKPSRLDRTADEVVSPFQSKPLPFQQPQQPQQPQAAPSPPAVEPIPPSTPSSSRGAPASAKPPTSSPSEALQRPATRGLSIEQYASLCAELATYPAQTEQVFLRYHLVSAQDRAAVDSEWRARLAKDPAEYKRWHELYWHYCTYLQQRR